MYLPTPLLLYVQSKADTAPAAGASNYRASAGSGVRGGRGSPQRGGATRRNDSSNQRSTSSSLTANDRPFS